MMIFKIGIDEVGVQVRWRVQEVGGCSIDIYSECRLSIRCISLHVPLPEIIPLALHAVLHVIIL